MDEEDSQDELINRNVSHAKGKRPATSIFSDEEDNSDDDSEEGETDSEEDEDDLEGEEEEEEDDDEAANDSDDDDAAKGLECAVGGGCTDLAALSSDEDTEKCPICLNSFHDQPVATPESCEHYFCLDCILEWSKNANSCPVDRIVFNQICLRKCHGGNVQKMITVQKPVTAGQEEQVDVDLEQTSCEVCGGSDREDRLLLCDGCDAGYHMECLTPPLNAVPVEEWFCPECAANNRNTRGLAEEVSEEEGVANALPTTSRSRPPVARPTRAIARTQQSERVRANVNRHRITQARTAEFAPRYMMQSTWLDETINSVVAGLSTAMYVRNLAPRPASRRRRRTVKRRKTKSKSSSAKSSSGKSSTTGVRRRKRRVRRTKSRRKLAVKKDHTSRSRIARSLGIRKPKRGSSIPSVYRPTEHTLGSMRADIGAASLSVYGDPYDLDPFDDRNEEVEQAPEPSSLLDAKRHGLSRSAMRSHQPVARPILAGLPRRGVGMPQVDAPVPDLLGSILSGQSMLLMDSSDVVINRDGSLKATKPVSLSSPKSSISGSASLGEAGSTPTSGASPFHSSGEAGPSCSPLGRAWSVHGSPGPGPLPTPPAPSPCLPCSPPHSEPSALAPARLHPLAPHRPSPAHAPIPAHGHWSARGGGHSPTRGANATSNSQPRERESIMSQPPAKKPPPKPVWVDVSDLPRIPKIKREGAAQVNSGGGGSNGFPDACVTSLTGNRGRQQSVDQQGVGAGTQGRTEGAQRHGADRAGPSFSSSFSSSSSSSSSPSNPRPSSSTTTVSFRISASGNSWHARRLAVPGVAAGAFTGSGEDEASRRHPQSKKPPQPSPARARDATAGRSDIYDPFNPTGSDSSGSEAESKACAARVSSAGHVPRSERREKGVSHRVKMETPDTDSGEGEEDKVLVKFKKEPEWIWDPLSCGDSLLPDVQKAEVAGTPMQSQRTVAAAMGDGGNPAAANAERGYRSSSASSFHADSKERKEVKPNPEDSPLPAKSRSRSPVGSPVDRRKTPKGSSSSKERQPTAGSTETGKRAREERRSRRSCSQERRRTRSSSHSPPSRASERRRTHSPSHSPPPRTSERSARKKRRSRSKDRRRSRSRSSSGESSRRRRNRRESRERYDSKGGDGQRRSKDKRRSQSRSRSTSRERRRDRPQLFSSSSKDRPQPSSSSSKDHVEARSKDKKRPRSRSRSRERKRGEGPSQGSHHKDRSAPKTEASSSASSSASSKGPKEPTQSSTKNTLSPGTAKEEKEAREIKREIPFSITSVKQENEPCNIIGSAGPSKLVQESKEPKDIKREKSLSVLKELQKTNEIKPENVWSLGVAKESQQLKEIKMPSQNLLKDSQEPKEIKKEKMPSPNVCLVSHHKSKEIKKEKVPSPNVCLISRHKSEEIKKEKIPSPQNLTIIESQESKKIKSDKSGSLGEEAASAQGDKSRKEQIFNKTKKIKVDSIWPDESLSSCSHHLLPVATAEPEAGIRSAEPEPGVQTVGPEAGVQTVGPEAGVQSAEPEAGVQSAGPETGVQSAEPEAGVHSAEPEAGVQSAEPEAGVQSAEPEAGVHSAESEAGVHSAEPEAGVQSAEPEAGVQSAEPEAGVHSAESEAGVQSAEPETGVQSAEPEAGVQSAEPEAGVQSAGPEAGVQSAGPEAGVQSAGPEAGVQSAGPEAGVQSAGPEAGVQSAGPEAGVQSAGPEAGVHSAGPEAGVQSAEPEPGVQSAEPEPGVQSAEPEPGVQSAEPEPGVQSAGPGPAVATPEESSSSQPSTVNTVVEPLQPTDFIKEEEESSDDEEINVDYMLDSLDFVKEGPESIAPDTSTADPADIQAVKQEAEAKAEAESAPGMVGTKTRAQVKRVTWNLQEPDVPQTEKTGKLALYKLKLKQEGFRKSATAPQTSNQEGALATAAPSILPQSDLDQEGSTAEEEDDSTRKDQYMKKLHMQERAVEEVKLAIKPFYQRRDITKEEYKEILRKAVQKVCHSKSGEINPVKVANLVKAYVEKYKHARKHHKDEEDGRSQETEPAKNSESPG